MKYAFLLSFSYKQYKDMNGEMTIHLNDRMIDSITLDEDIKLKNVKMVTQDSDGHKRYHNYIRPEKMFYYEIEDTELLYPDKDNILKLTVSNDNNNYTNGFMTKTSLLTIDNIFFMPKKLWNLSKQLSIRSRLEKNFWKDFYSPDVWIQTRPEWKKYIDEAKAFFKLENDTLEFEGQTIVAQQYIPLSVESKKDRSFMHKYLMQTYGAWPGIVHPLDYVITSKTPVHSKIPNFSEGWPIGGSFETSLPISKKHNIYAIRQKKYKGPFFPAGNCIEAMIEIFRGVPECKLINTNSVLCNNTVDFKFKNEN